MKSNIHGRDDYINNRIDITALLTNIKAGIRRLFWVPLILAVIFGGMSYLNSLRSYVPMYTATATFTVSVNMGEQYNTEYIDSSLASSMKSVFPYVVSSTQLMQMVAEDMGLDYVPGTVNATNMAETNLFTLEVTASDGQQAYDMLKSVMNCYPKVIERILGSITMKLIDEPMVPYNPSNAKSGIYSAKHSAETGFLLGILLILAYAFTRNTVQDPRFLSKRLNTECLAKIKQVKTKKHRNTKAAIATVTSRNVDYGFRESFRVLRTRILRRCKKYQAKSVMVTSTFPGEGKTTMAINLAMSIAEAGNRVILADCDLRKSSIYEALPQLKDADKTIEDFISGQADIGECMYQIDDLSLFVIPSKAKMYGEASEAIGSDDMAKAIAIMEANADYVIVDSSPMDMMADASVLARLVDASVFVVRYNYGKARYVLRAAKELKSCPATMFGYIFNGQHDLTREYGYGGKYSHYNSYGKYGSER